MNNQIRNLDKNSWPKTLLELPKSQIPKKLRIIGEKPNWNQKRVCIIGSRNYSDYGLAVTKKIINEIAGYPITIVSGLAYGIDSLAHRFALENSMKTIAIPGSGLNKDVIYPKRHFSLAEEIIKNKGCLISEYNDDQLAANWTFPQRNRIMAGISNLVVIIEAAEKSGTMITARLALDYNIDVSCVPGSIFHQTSCGTNKLLKEGAEVIRNGQDILDILKIKKKKNNRKVPASLDDDQIKIFRLLKNPLSKEEILEKSKIEISKLNQIISSLEIKGLIEFSENKICQK